MALARRAGAESALEFQVLRGLGDDLAEALAACGQRVRDYCPVGDLVAGMAYLVRRLLENTSNDSFLPRRPQARRSRSCSRPMTRRPPRAAGLPPFANEPLAELRRPEVRAVCREALDELDARGPRRSTP